MLRAVSKAAAHAERLLLLILKGHLLEAAYDETANAWCLCFFAADAQADYNHEEESTIDVCAC